MMYNIGDIIFYKFTNGWAVAKIDTYVNSLLKDYLDYKVTILHQSGEYKVTNLWPMQTIDKNGILLNKKEYDLLKVLHEV